MRAVIVQARMGSKRLPGKVLLPLNGHTVLEEVLTRCKRIGADMVVCAIPFSDSEALTRVAMRVADKVFCGQEDDVLGRFVGAANHVQADVVMRITADCPLICPALCAEVLSKVPEYDYASNVHPRTFPKGLDCEAFTIEALRKAHLYSDEREHVTTWMLTAPIRRTNVASRWNIEGRVTLDTEDDYRTICASFSADERLRAA